MDGTAIQELLKHDDVKFTKTLQALNMEDVMSVIQELQQEMAGEQAHFNALKSELEQCVDGAESVQGQGLTEAMVESQDRLQQLMDRTKQCFGQKSDVQEKEDFYAEEINGVNGMSDTEQNGSHQTVWENNNTMEAKPHPIVEEEYGNKVSSYTFTPASINVKTGDDAARPNNDESNGGVNTLPNNHDNLNMLITPHSDDNVNDISLPHRERSLKPASSPFHYQSNTTVQLTNINNSSSILDSEPAEFNNSSIDITSESLGSSHNSSDMQAECKELVSDDDSHHITESVIHQEKAYTIRSMSNRSQLSSTSSSVSHERHVSTSSQSSEADGEEDNKTTRRLSVAEARGLFESGSNNGGPIKVKRNFSVGSTSNKKQEEESKSDHKKKYGSSNADSNHLPNRSISMQNFERPSLNKPFRSHEIGISTNIKTSNSATSLSDVYDSKPGVIKDSQGPVKPMSRAPVVRVAWSQKPGSSNTQKALAINTQTPAGNANSHKPSSPLPKQVVSTNEEKQKPQFFVPVENQSKPVQEFKTQQYTKLQQKKQPTEAVKSSTVQLKQATAPVNNFTVQQKRPTAAVKASTAHCTIIQQPPKVESSTFQIPKLRPVQMKIGNPRNMGNVVENTPAQRNDIPQLKADTTSHQHHHQNPQLQQPQQHKKVVIITKKDLPDDRVPPALSHPMTKDSEGFHAEDSVQDRVTLKGWDPTPLLEDLYQVVLHQDASEDGFSYINIEGFMEKLPMNKRKATLLKTWKKRYFKALDGSLYYYELEDLEKATGCLPLSGGSVEDLGENMLGIDDGRGRYLVVRCADTQEFNDWKRALDTQVVGNMTSRWVKPVQSSPNSEREVIIIDLGSCSVRAGILGDKPTLPHLFFPTVVGIDNQTGQEYVGFDCAPPEVRARSKFIFPVRPTVKVDKHSLNMEVMPVIFKHIFKNLKVDPKKYWIMFCAPANFSDKIKEDFMNIFVKTFGVKGVNIVNQTLLALYSYNAMSGIVVDIGERLEIVPVTDGYIVEQGVSRQPYGGQRIREALNNMLTEKRYRFFTDVEFQIVRLVFEKSCFTSQDYASDLGECNENPEDYRKSISLEKYDLPKGSWTQVSNDVGRFKSTEGLFNLSVWGMDNPPLHKLIQDAIQACPMDTRREMWRVSQIKHTPPPKWCILAVVSRRSVYVSGGVTMLPGFVSRLEKELSNLAPNSITVEVHSSPQRYHSAYLGACALASMTIFQQSCITAEEWISTGAPVLRKWHMY